MSRVEDLYNTGRELDNTWKGDANKAFSTILGNDRDKFEGLKTLVDRYIENLRNDADEYDRAESVNLETLSSSTIRKK
jgi:uncharacterized protein YukE